MRALLKSLLLLLLLALPQAGAAQWVGRERVEISEQVGFSTFRLSTGLGVEMGEILILHPINRYTLVGAHLQLGTISDYADYAALTPVYRRYIFPLDEEREKPRWFRPFLNIGLGAYLDLRELVSDRPNDFRLTPLGGIGAEIHLGHVVITPVLNLSHSFRIGGKPLDAYDQKIMRLHHGLFYSTIQYRF